MAATKDAISPIPCPEHPDTFQSLIDILFKRHCRQKKLFCSQIKKNTDIDKNTGSSSSSSSSSHHQDPLSWTMKQVASKAPSWLMAVAQSSNQPLVLVTTDNKKKWKGAGQKLLFDGRCPFFYKEKWCGRRRRHTLQPLLIVNNTRSSNLSVRRKWPCSKKPPRFTLAGALELTPSLADPQTLEELNHFLKHHGLEESVIVYRTCCPLTRNKVPWFKPLSPPPPPPLTPTTTGPRKKKVLVAVPDKQLVLRYRKVRVLPKLTRPLKPETQHGPSNATEQQVNNQNTSVNFKSTSLGLALQLALITEEEALSLTSRLAQCIGTLVHCTDDQRHIRCLLYANAHVTFYCHVACDTSKSDTKMAAFFDRVLKAQQELSRDIADILEPLLHRIAPFGICRSLHQLLHRQLTKAISTTKILTFFPDDSLMHFLKLPFAAAVSADMASRKKIFQGIRVKLNSDNTIIGLCAGVCHIRDASVFFDFERSNFDPNIHARNFEKVFSSWTGQQFVSTETVWPHGGG